MTYHVPTKDQCLTARYHLRSAAESAILGWWIEGEFHRGEVINDLQKAAAALGCRLAPSDQPQSDLVKRLRVTKLNIVLTNEAADRIEALEATNAKLENLYVMAVNGRREFRAALVKARQLPMSDREKALIEALKNIAGGCFPDASNMALAGMRQMAYGALQGIAVKALAAYSPPPVTSEPTMSEREKVLVEVLIALLDYEQRVAKLQGYSDCTCINHSRQFEIKYETGTCPHQIARQVLRIYSPPPVTSEEEQLEQERSDQAEQERTDNGQFGVGA